LPDEKTAQSTKPAKVRVKRFGTRPLQVIEIEQADLEQHLKNGWKVTNRPVSKK